MSDAVGREGITVTELAGIDQPIDASPETTVAFIGRALRGPLDTAVAVRNFGEFRRRFGDSWPRSALGPAVRDFFDHGGRRLYVVRVANNARGAMLCLPAYGSALVLKAIEPGSTERLRAAVDYDGCDATDSERFNLTIQRIDPQTGRVIDQEIFRGLDWCVDADDFVVDRLLASQLARVGEPWPAHRPEPTLAGGNRYAPDWIVPAQPGTDGNELSDYDLVGSRTRGTGLFALDSLEKLDLLYLPPRGRDADNGPAALLAAEMYCRERGAMLVVDPQAEWHSGSEAVAGLRAQGLASANAMTYFPRLAPERGDVAGRAAGAALAGLLCRQDRQNENRPGDDGIALRRSLSPAIGLSETDAARLMRAGINAIVQDVAGRIRLTGDCTLAHGNGPNRDSNRLSVRRLSLRITNAIDRATRWCVFAKPDNGLVTGVREQVVDYLRQLHEKGVLDADFVVQCHPGFTSSSAARGVTLMLAFRPQGCRAPLTYTLEQSPAGCRVSASAFMPLTAHCA